MVVRVVLVVVVLQSYGGLGLNDQNVERRREVLIDWDVEVRSSEIAVSLPIESFQQSELARLSLVKK